MPSDTFSQSAVFGIGRRLVLSLILLALMVLTPIRLSAELIFSGLDLSEDNRLIFRVDSDHRGAQRQSALFISSIAEPGFKLRQLTLFPETMELVEYGQTLQVRNVLGTMRVPISGGIPRSIPGLPAFTDGVPALGGRLEEIASSSDGKWVLQVEPISPAYGNLILIDTVTGTRTLITSHIERPGARFPACWSPDSRVFVYSRGGRLYYQTINTANSVPISSMDERYRYIGDGGINSVTWGVGGDFFYLHGSTVYRVWGSELFARALYRDFLEIGSTAGKIPFEFDENFDSFWIAPDSRSILLVKGGWNVFYFPLSSLNDTTDTTLPLPYIKLPQSCSKLQVLWSPQGLITLLAAIPLAESAPGPGGAGYSVIAYRFNTGSSLMSIPISAKDRKESPELPVFRSLASPEGFRGALSPDGTRALIWGTGRAVLYDYTAWEPLQTLGDAPAYSCLWLGNQEFILGTNSWIEQITLKSPSSTSSAPQSDSSSSPPAPPDYIEARRFICPASAAEAGFEEQTGLILFKVGDTWFSTDGSKPWTTITGPVMRRPSQTSSQYRVYLEWQNAGPYSNIPMIRHITSQRTTPLLPIPRFPDPVLAAESRPARNDIDIPLAPSLRTGRELFTHGKRAGSREIALCFDLYDDATGLPEVLETLRLFGLRATFFLNGEFIRRYPTSARDIAAAGHEMASLFFSPIDISDTRYQVREDFILQGLGRNEDDFFKATGKELALLWHPPYYAISSDIVAAAAQGGYITIGRDVDPLDWVTQEEARQIGLAQYAAPAIIDRIMEQIQPGSIVPIRLGLLPGGRSDYLFGSLPVLLDALIRSDLKPVPVSVLLEQSR